MSARNWAHRGETGTVRPGDGDWMAITRLSGWQTWLIRFTCGHGRMVHVDTQRASGLQIILSARRQQEVNRRFICMHCSGGDFRAGWGPFYWIADIRRLDPHEEGSGG